MVVRVRYIECLVGSAVVNSKRMLELSLITKAFRVTEVEQVVVVSIRTSHVACVQGRAVDATDSGGLRVSDEVVSFSFVGASRNTRRLSPGRALWFSVFVAFSSTAAET